MSLAQPMETAPKDRRILIKTMVLHYSTRHGRYMPDGEQWVECWWTKNHSDVEGWQKWCGNERTLSTNLITPLVWAELPGENE